MIRWNIHVLTTHLYNIFTQENITNNKLYSLFVVRLRDGSDVRSRHGRAGQGTTAHSGCTCIQTQSVPDPYKTINNIDQYYQSHLIHLIHVLRQDVSMTKPKLIDSGCYSGNRGQRCTVFLFCCASDSSQ